MPKRTSDPQYRKNRAELLQNNPECALCGKPGADTADHIIPYDAGGSDDLDNLRPAHRACNSRAGAAYVNRKRAIQSQQRNRAVNNKPPENLFLKTESLPPTFSSEKSLNSHDSVQDSLIQPDTSVVGQVEPRLVTPTIGYESFGPSIAEFSAQTLGRELFDWQKLALDRSWQHDDDLNFVHSKALISCARQNGKTTMNAAIVGWALTVLPRIWGRPVRILSAAHELSLASEVFEELREHLELWEESGLCKVTWAYGRHEVRMVDGSRWKVSAATAKKHGGSWDILLLDEIWSITEGAIFGALLPSQIAVPSPLCWMTSTAGDEGSLAFIKFREQAIGCIDSGTASDLFMAEWSLPPGVDPEDERFFGFSNPSLGKTITMKGLRSAAAAPDRTQFLRAHCNLWVSAAQSWMPHGMWSKRKTDWNEGEGGYLSVDSATDGSKYVGVWARPDPDGHVVVSMAFTTESNFEMWHEITTRLEADPKLKLAITPGLYVHTPEKFRLRTTQWGYGELLKFVGVVRSFIIEGRILHTGETMLAEHVNRAVLVKAENCSSCSCLC
jgi:hypothetical protein